MNSSIISNRSSWSAASIAFLSMFFLGVPVSRGEIMHRYFFSEESLQDLVGKQNGQGPTGAEFDAVKFSEDVPEKASGVSLDLSEVEDGKISGLSLPGSVLRAESGAYTLWIKAAQEVEGEKNNYIIASTPLQEGVSLVLRNRSRVLVHAKGKNIGPVTVAPQDDWHHMAVVWDATNDSAAGPRAELYIDGKTVGSVALEGAVSAKKLNCGTYQLEYGFDNSGQSFAAHQYRGLIYDLQIYGDSLTAGQVKKLYENPGMALGEISENTQPDSEQ